MNILLCALSVNSINHYLYLVQIAAAINKLDLPCLIVVIIIIIIIIIMYLIMISSWGFTKSCCLAYLGLHHALESLVITPPPVLVQSDITCHCFLGPSIISDANGKQEVVIIYTYGVL